MTPKVYAVVSRNPFGVVPCHMRVPEVDRTGVTAWAGPCLAYMAGRPVVWHLKLQVLNTGLLVWSISEQGPEPFEELGVGY